MDYPAARPRDKTYERIHDAVQGVEEKMARAKHGGDQEVVVGLKVPLTPGDIAFLVEDIYRGRSAITSIPTRIVLIRWTAPDYDTLLRIGEGRDEQKSVRLRLSDLVCMTKEEATRHQKEVLLGGKSPEDLYDKDVIDRVRSRIEEASAYEKYR